MITDVLNVLITKLNNILWGIPAIVFLTVVGVILGFSMKFLPFRNLPLVFKRTLGSLGKSSSSSEVGTISRFGAVCASLAATVGMGNIVGVAAAICTGGPGAVFWMIIAAFLGATMKYYEVALTIMYREQNEVGEYRGGPSMYVEKGLGIKWLGALMTILTALACLVSNMIQSNTFITNFNSIVPVTANLYVEGVILAIIIGIIVVGGIKRLGVISEILVPIMALSYLLFGIVVLAVNAKQIPETLVAVVTGAFTPVAVGGGAIGYGFSYAIRYGFARGFFSNGGGQAIFSIAHAPAKVNNPIEQAIWAIPEIFIDCAICLISALTVLTSGLPLDSEVSATLVNKAFAQTYGPLEYIVCFALLLFSFTTIAGFGYMGEAQLSTLIKPRYIKVYRALFIVLCFIGCISKPSTMWNMVDVIFGIIMFVNLPILVIQRKKVIALTQKYFAQIQK